jgi:hypothetical protein
MAAAENICESSAFNGITKFGARSMRLNIFDGAGFERRTL